ncbi:MAG: hypothetical protein KatS3mg059_1301 [Thermomicrobiales bacterium]|nr:MAG: hypothetical protein KatS3mg059_1301 [Thermomicrobiales bacterium]
MLMEVLFPTPDDRASTTSVTADSPRVGLREVLLQRPLPIRGRSCRRLPPPA